MTGWSTKSHSGYPTLRLKTIARLINELGNGFTAEIEEGYCNTDRKPAGCRYITHKGKGRRGNRLIVRDPQKNVVFDHNAAETYRDNSQVLYWVDQKFGRIWEK